MDKSTLLGYMHNYYETSSVVDEHLNTNATELTTFKTKLGNVLNQFFVDTADYTLARWEKQLGITVNENIDAEFRRSRIKSKLRGQGTITVTMIKNVAESFQNGEVDVIEDNANYSFTIKFVSTKGIPGNIGDLQKAIEDIKPAHLALEYKFTFTIWNDISSTQWDYFSDVQWDALKLIETPQPYDLTTLTLARNGLAINPLYGYSYTGTGAVTPANTFVMEPVKSTEVVNNNMSALEIHGYAVLVCHNTWKLATIIVDGTI